jgi:hypothetical protein
MSSMDAMLHKSIQEKGSGEETDRLASELYEKRLPLL